MKKFFGFVLGIVLVSGTAAAQGRSEDAAGRALARLKAQGVANGNARVHSVISDSTGNHVRVNETAGGVPVWGSQIITHEKGDGRFDGDTGSFRFGNYPLSTKPSLTGADAVRAALVEFGGDGSADVELMIYPRGTHAWSLVYSVDVRNTDVETNEPRREQIIIDAHNGSTIDKWNNLQTGAATGTGKGYYAGTVSSFPVDLTSGSYTTFDVPNNGKTYDFNNRTCNIFGCGTNTGTIYSDADGTFGTDGSLSVRASIGVDAHFFAQKTLEYVKTTFLRNGIDNSNNTTLRMKHMVSRTHYGKSYNNAFWDGASMTYGDGDGTTYRPFDAIDVVGHEMQHGITERTSNLRYQNESGAANESFSDIIGVAVEFYTGTLSGFGGQSYPADWWIGEDLYVASNPASPTRGIRHMSDPHKEGDPCHYSERYTGTSDNGGVHINSGIQNKVYSLLSLGTAVLGTNHKDTSNTQVTALAGGWADAAKIAFDADTKYCTIDDTYLKVANAWVNAAKNRFGAGSAAAVQTVNAWKACGVTPTAAP